MSPAGGLGSILKRPGSERSTHDLDNGQKSCFHQGLIEAPTAPA